LGPLSNPRIGWLASAEIVENADGACRVVVLAVFVLAEKVSKRGEMISRIGGVIMIAWGVASVLGG
jgi:predicted metal-binding membrane protein